MRLLLPSLLIVAYVFASLILFMPVRPLLKLAAGLLLLLAGLKYVFYERFGGSFLIPALPEPLLLIMEAAYAFLLLLFFLLLVKDATAVLLWLSRLLGSSWQLPFSPLARGAGLTMAALILTLLGVWQAGKTPMVRTLEVTVPRLPASLDGLTLAQLSDLHMGALRKKGWLQEVVAKTNALQADLILLTGDMIDGRASQLAPELQPLAELRARHGVFGVTGNHEYYSNAGEWLPVFQGLGISMLRNAHATVPVNGQAVIVAGLPDPTEERFGGESPDLAKALAGAPDGVRILLAHQPRSAAQHAPFADLQLSGHTHGGHLFFLQPVIAAFNEGFVKGPYRLGGMTLYVSPGTGLWSGFFTRLGVPSEITQIILRAPKQSRAERAQ